MKRPPPEAKPYGFAVPQDVTLNTSQGPVAYSYDNFLTEHIWGHQAFRANRRAAELQASLESKLLGCVAGQFVQLTRAEYELFAPVATLQGGVIQGPVSVQFSRFARAVLLAAPREEKPVKS